MDIFVAITGNTGISHRDVIDREGLVGEFLDNVLVVRQIQGRIPFEIFSLDRHSVDRHLDSPVIDITDIGGHGSERITVGRDRIIVDQVACVLVVELDCTIQAAIEECEIQSDVEHASPLPFQIWIRVVGGGQGMLVRRVAVGVGIVEPTGDTVGLDCRVSVEAQRVTADTITRPEFQVVEQVQVLDEILVAQSPCGRERGEGRPAVVASEG